MNLTGRGRVGYIAPLVVLVFLIVLPAFGSQFFVEFVVTRASSSPVASTDLSLGTAGWCRRPIACLCVAGFVIGNCVRREQQRFEARAQPVAAVVADRSSPRSSPDSRRASSRHRHLLPHAHTHV